MLIQARNKQIYLHFRRDQSLTVIEKLFLAARPMEGIGFDHGMSALERRREALSITERSDSVVSRHSAA
ncbi:hypothetical protein [Glycomyces tarimensis]